MSYLFFSIVFLIIYHIYNAYIYLDIQLVLYYFHVCLHVFFLFLFFITNIYKYNCLVTDILLIFIL